MKTSTTLALAASALLATASAAFAFDPGAVAAGRRDLQQAVNAADVAKMMAVRARFAALAQAEPADPLLHYWVAVATWRVVPFQMQKDRKLAEKLGDDGLDHLEKALAKDPKFADALALKGGLQGMLISLKPGAMMTLGPQSGANLTRALALEPANPRVSLLMGIGDLHKPAVFGGGPKPALESFRRAEDLFARESVADSTRPDWGRDDAFLWEGRAAMELKDYEAASAAFHRALEANPANGWVRTRLLPEAEQAIAAKEKK